jgi:hypothetical protein
VKHIVYRYLSRDARAHARHQLVLTGGSEDIAYPPERTRSTGGAPVRVRRERLR